MKALALLLLLSACTVAGSANDPLLDDLAVSVDDAGAPDDMAGFMMCGNGNTYCPPGTICDNGDCLVLCGAPLCFQELQAAWNQCPSSPARMTVQPLRRPQ